MQRIKRLNPIQSHVVEAPMPSIKAIKIALRLGPDNWQFTAVACALGALTFVLPLLCTSSLVFGIVTSFGSSQAAGTKHQGQPTGGELNPLLLSFTIRRLLKGRNNAQTTRTHRTHP